MEACLSRIKIEGGKYKCTQNQDGGMSIQNQDKEVRTSVLRTKMEGGKCMYTQNPESRWRS